MRNWMESPLVLTCAPTIMAGRLSLRREAMRIPRQIGGLGRIIGLQPKGRPAPRPAPKPAPAPKPTPKQGK